MRYYLDVVRILSFISDCKSIYRTFCNYLGDCWDNGSRAVKAASLAAASQCLRTFCVFLKDEAEEVIRTSPTPLMTVAQASAVYNECIPVMQWLCSRLVEPK